MPLPTDDEIVDWKNDFGGADTNVPAGDDTVGPFLDEQFRLIKHVVRNESVNKQWEHWQGLYGTIAPISATQFSLTGDRTGLATVNRRVKCTVTAGTAYGTITASSFAAGVTTITVLVDGGVSLAGITEAQFGVLTATEGALPGNVLTSVAVLYAIAAGTDTYTASLSPAISAYVVGQEYRIKFTNANTTIATLNLNGLGAKPLLKNGVSVLVAGDIVAGQILPVIYDGTSFQIVGARAISSVLAGENVAVANSGTTETTAFTFSIPANTLAANRDSLRITAVGQMPNSNQHKRAILLYLGATKIAHMRVEPGSNTNYNWKFEAIISRTGSAAQDVSSLLVANTKRAAGTGAVSVLAVGNLDSAQQFTSTVENLATTLVLTLKIQTDTNTANDVIADGWIVEKLAA